MESQDGLGGKRPSSSSYSLAMGRDTLPCPRLFQASLNLALDTSNISSANLSGGWKPRSLLRMDWQRLGPRSKRIPCSSCLLHWVQNIPWQTGGLGTAQQTRQSQQVKAVVTESLLASRNSQTGGNDGGSSRMTSWGCRFDSILGIPGLGLQGRARLWFKGQTSPR